MPGGILRAGMNRCTEGRDRAIRQGRAGRQGIGLYYDSRLHDDAFKRRRRLEIGTLDTAISATCQHTGGQPAQKAHGIDCYHWKLLPLLIEHKYPISEDLPYSRILLSQPSIRRA